MKIDAGQLMAMRSAILQQNGALQKAAQAAADPANLKLEGGTGKADFGASLRDALSQVNGLQAKAEASSDAYDRGETSDIAAVMLQRETASVGFQATLQVRNKLLAAYKDIMSMPV